jgi:hypothetical protein
VFKPPKFRHKATGEIGITQVAARVAKITRCHTNPSEHLVFIKIYVSWKRIV